jgi:hypothetical protein
MRGQASRLLISAAAATAFLAARPWQIQLDRLELHPLHLGVGPLVAAFLLVEGMAALVPSWRPLRRRGRAVLRRVAWLVAGIITAAAACSGAREPAEGVVWALAVAAIAGTAELVRKHGVGDGYAVLVLAAVVPEPRQLASAGRTGGEQAILGVVVLASVVAATVMVLRAHERSRGPRLPVCGVLPLDGAALLFGLPAALETPAAAALGHLTRSSNLLFAGATAVVLAASLSALGARGRDGAVLAGVRSTLFVAALFAAGSLVATVPAILPGVYGVTLVAAVVLDLAREWRARGADTWAAVAAPASVAEVEAAQRMLEEAGVPCFVRGIAFRSLLLLAGSFVTLEVWVPQRDATRAAAVLLDS